MPRILVTGMSGTGKSTAMRELARRGHRVVDAGDPAWSSWQHGADGEPDWMWDQGPMAALLDEHVTTTLFVAGCSANQGRFYDRFDHVVLLSAPVELMIARIDARTDNAFGKSARERAKVLADLRDVEPLLRATCTSEIVTDVPPDEVADRLELLAGRTR